MNRDQLASILRDLNGGVNVEESVVDAVLERASNVSPGAVTKPDLVKAISVW